MKRFITRHAVILAILLGGILVRLYRFQELFYYAHDQDLASWIMRDILENGVRLIGQETSSSGVFIGPLFYYSLIPFYALFGGDPIGGVFLSAAIGAAAIVSVYYIVTKLYAKDAGTIAAVIFAFSNVIVMTDREVVPTTPAMLASMWLFYALIVLLRGKQKQGFLIAGITLGLVWNINLAIGIVAPLFAIAFIASRKRLDIKAAALGLGAFCVLMVPYAAFEYRHGFSQTKAIMGSVTTDTAHIPGTSDTFGEKLDRTFQIVAKNTTNILWGEAVPVRRLVALFVFVTSILYLFAAKKISQVEAILFLLWQGMYILFFTLNAINLSEYYLNGMNIIWVVGLSLMLAHLVKKKSRWVWGSIALFVLLNLYRLVTVPVNHSGYRERTAIIKEITADAKLHHYPCVAISYITSPGNDLGYRYLIYREGLHANQSKSGSPVYSIVFPLSKVDRIDKSFGALGLIYPDYARYTKEDIQRSCSGENANLTDPLFGFVN